MAVSVLSATQLLQAFNDAGITDQATATRLVRLLLKNLLIQRQIQLANGPVDRAYTAAEVSEMASNEASIAKLTQLIG